MKVLFLSIFVAISLCGVGKADDFDIKEVDRLFKIGFDTELTVEWLAKLADYFDLQELQDRYSKTNISNEITKWEDLSKINKAHLIIKYTGHSINEVKLKKNAPKFLRLYDYFLDGENFEFAHKKPRESLQEFLNDLSIFAKHAGIEKKVYHPEKINTSGAGFHYHISRKLQKGEESIAPIVEALNVLYLIERVSLGVDQDLEPGYPFKYTIEVTQRGLVRLVVKKGDPENRMEGRTHYMDFNTEFKRNIKILSLPHKEALIYIKSEIKKVLNNEIIKKIANARDAGTYILDNVGYPVKYELLDNTWNGHTAGSIWHYLDGKQKALFFREIQKYFLVKTTRRNALLKLEELFRETNNFEEFLKVLGPININVYKAVTDYMLFSLELHPYLKISFEKFYSSGLLDSNPGFHEHLWKMFKRQNNLFAKIGYLKNLDRIYSKNIVQYPKLRAEKMLIKAMRKSERVEVFKAVEEFVKNRNPSKKIITVIQDSEIIIQRNLYYSELIQKGSLKCKSALTSIYQKMFH